jgi:hypothetical protein
MSKFRGLKSYVREKEEFYFYDKFGPADPPIPTASVTPSVTVTPTPSYQTPTPTPTISLTPSITPSITPTISLTASITPTQTPTTTPNVSPSMTPTPSSTPNYGPAYFEFQADVTVNTGDYNNCSPAMDLYCPNIKSTGDIKIDWGDGTIDTYSGSVTRPSHTYSSGQYKNVKIYSTTGIIDFINWNQGGFGTGLFDKAKVVKILNFGSNFIPSYSNSMIQFLHEFTPGLLITNCLPSTPPNLDYVTDLSDAFSVNSGNYLEMNDPDVNNWNVSNVTNMTRMFQYSKFDQPLDKWDTSNVTSMVGMFKRGGVVPDYNFDQDLSMWNISSLLNAIEMFDYCDMSTTNYDKLLIGWASQAPNIQSNVGLGARNLKYTLGGAAEAARNVLVNTYNWNIVGDSGV